MIDLPTKVQDPPIRLLAAFNEVYPSLSPSHVIQPPGRDMWIAAAVNTTREYTLHASDLGGRTKLNWRSAKQKMTVLRRPLPRWARYPAGVIYLLGDTGIEVDGVDVVIVGDEAHGPRYDFALGVTVAALWYELNDLPYTPESLIDLVERVRREYIGG